MTDFQQPSEWSKQLTERWVGGMSDAELLEELADLVRKTLSEWRAGLPRDAAVDDDDLGQEIAIVILDEARRFDPGKGKQLVSWLTERLHDARVDLVRRYDAEKRRPTVEDREGNRAPRAVSLEGMTEGDSENAEARPAFEVPDAEPAVVDRLTETEEELEADAKWQHDQEIFRSLWWLVSTEDRYRQQRRMAKRVLAGQAEPDRARRSRRSKVVMTALNENRDFYGAVFKYFWPGDPNVWFRDGDRDISAPEAARHAEQWLQEHYPDFLPWFEAHGRERPLPASERVTRDWWNRWAGKWAPRLAEVHGNPRRVSAHFSAMGTRIFKRFRE